MTPQFLSQPNRLEYYNNVWEIVRKIPTGMVATYGQIASLIPVPQGATESGYKAFGPRWVGSAMAACPDDVPWHRVVNSQGQISFRGSNGQNVQKELLESEGVKFDERGRINLSIYRWSGIAAAS